MNENKFEKLDDLLSLDDANSVIIELDNFIGQLCSYGEEIDKLNEPQRIFYLNQNLEREVNNGGFRQFFTNSSGGFAHQTIQSLTAIGAATTAATLQEAIAQFPDARVPQNMDERFALVEIIDESAGKIWDELNGKFFAYEDDLNALNLEFIRKHKEDF